MMIVLLQPCPYVEPRCLTLTAKFDGHSVTFYSYNILVNSTFIFSANRLVMFQVKFTCMYNRAPDKREFLYGKQNFQVIFLWGR